MNAKLMEVDVNTTVATLWDHLNAFVNKASLSLVMDYNAMVTLYLLLPYNMIIKTQCVNGHT